MILLLIIHWANRESLPAHFQLAIPEKPTTWLEFSLYQPTSWYSGKLLSGKELRLLQIKVVFFLKKLPKAPQESRLLLQLPTGQCIIQGTSQGRLVVQPFKECKIRRKIQTQTWNVFNRRLFRGTALRGNVTCKVLLTATEPQFSIINGEITMPRSEAEKKVGSYSCYCMYCLGLLVLYHLSLGRWA